MCMVENFVSKINGDFSHLLQNGPNLLTNHTV